MSARRRPIQFLLLVALLAGPWLARAGEASDPPDRDEKPSSWWPFLSWTDHIWGLGLRGVEVGNGANRVTGSDKLVHQLRLVAGVHAIALEGPIDVVVRQGQSEKLTVHTDDNIVPLILTTVQDGVLHIGVQPGVSFRTRHPIGISAELERLDGVKVLGSGDLSCPQLKAELLEVTIAGSGSVRIDALDAKALAVLIQGSGDVHLSGHVPSQGYVIEGSGDVDADELTGRELAVRVTGSGDAKVWATDKLAIDVTGSGDVVYRGSPLLTRSVTGSGTIKHEK
jgi:hypothetical protein